MKVEVYKAACRKVLSFERWQCGGGSGGRFLSFFDVEPERQVAVVPWVARYCSVVVSFGGAVLRRLSMSQPAAAWLLCRVPPPRRFVRR
jgi:hypothetical protein